MTREKNEYFNNIIYNTYLIQYNKKKHDESTPLYQYRTGQTRGSVRAMFEYDENLNLRLQKTEEKKTIFYRKIRGSDEKSPDHTHKR